MASKCLTDKELAVFSGEAALRTIYRNRINRELDKIV